MTVKGELWIRQLGDLSSVSLACICALYVLSESRFRRSGVAPVRSIVLAVLFANAFLQSYEIVLWIHGVFLPVFNASLFRTAILWIVMVSPLLLMREYLRFTLWSKALLASFAAVAAIWVLYGFPQYYLEGNHYLTQPILKTSDPFRLSLWLNFGSKAIWAALYASLLDPGETLRHLVRGSKETRRDFR